jgi:hypothetical protein
MSTIVTYNRTVAPNVDGSGGPVKYFNDFNGESDAAFFTVSDFAIAAGENGIFKNADGLDISSAISSVLNSPNLSKEGDYIAFAVRARMTAQTNGDDAYFGLGDAAAVSTSLSHGLAFALTQAAAASGDTVIGAFDDNNVENDTPVITISDIIEDWDSTEYHVYSAEVKVAGGVLSAQFYIDGKPLASKRRLGGAVGSHEFTAARLGLFFYQAASTSLLQVDWVSYEATRK